MRSHRGRPAARAAPSRRHGSVRARRRPRSRPRATRVPSPRARRAGRPRSGAETNASQWGSMSPAGAHPASSPHPGGGLGGGARRRRRDRNRGGGPPAPRARIASLGARRAPVPMRRGRGLCP